MTRYIKLTMVMLMVSVLAVSCDDFLDVNTDPNRPTAAPYQGLMINTTLETARNTQRVAASTGYFFQHLVSPNAATSIDIHAPVSLGTIWSSIYFTMGDLAQIINQAEEQGATHYVGVAKVLQAYNLGLLVSTFGDVPYEEAFFAQTLTPKYDSDEALYGEILQLLADAIVALQSTTSLTSPGNDDLIFRGNRPAWIRTAHALRARYLNHYSKLPSYNPQQILNHVDNAFQSNAQDFQMAFFTENATVRNPWYTVALNNAGLLLGGWLSDQIIDHMNGTIYGVFDPRLPLITMADTSSGNFIGTRNGAGRGAARERFERAALEVGSFYASGPTAPLEMATFAEMKFIEAEAALGIDANRAFAAYEAGIRAHMTKLGVAQADIDAYWSNPEVSDRASFGRDKIMKEKYVALFLNPETWNDARRYDYAYARWRIPANHNPDLGGQMIRRARYPDSEIQRNASQMPNKSLTDRLFWDVP